MDVLEVIKGTPLPTLLVVIGIVALSVGYGLKIKAAIDVDNINRAYAKTIGIILLILGLVPYISDISPFLKSSESTITDPFLIYYMVSVPIIVAFLGAASKFTNGQVQVRTLKLCFILISTFLSFVVLWRGIDIYFFVNSTNVISTPMGLYTRSNYVPYLVLLSTGVGVTVWLFYINTRQQKNIENRIKIFQYFSIFCVYLVVCRLIWEVVDYIAKIKVPAPS